MMRVLDLCRVVSLSGLLLLCALPVALSGCDKGASETEKEGRDWRPVVEQIDEALVRQVLTEQGWTLSEEPPFTATLTAEDVREMGGKAAGDTHMTTYSATKGERSVQVTFTTYPGDVQPARGDRGRVLGAPLLAAGSKGVGVTVSDAEYEEHPDEADALLDALIAAAEAKVGGE